MECSVDAEKMKILLIGFEKENDIKYPHLYQVLESLTRYTDIEYLYFKERGYLLTDSEKKFENFLYDFKDRFIEYINNKLNYQIIAIDNLTFALASIFFNKVILWSHDFVTSDQEHFNSNIQIEIRKYLLSGLKKNKRIIIQDYKRYQLFLKTLFISNHSDLKVFYLPVSLQRISNYQNKDIEKIKQPILLQIGGINQFRSNSLDLIKNYQKDSNIYKLMLHGFFEKSIKSYLENIQILPIISKEILSGINVDKIVKKCDIGIICYNIQNENFYLTSHASGQLVEFLRCSKPVIIFGHTNLKKYVKENFVGISIESLEELDNAILTIQKDYTLFSYNAQELFKKTYDLDIYIPKLNKWIEND